MTSITINENLTIGDESKVFIIAEAGVNHNGSVKIAKELIDAAKFIGADAVKFQSFIADEIILKKAPKAKYHIETTGSDTEQTWHELLQSEEISVDMHEEIFNYAKKSEILCLSTPYDKISADLISEMGTEIIKVASTDNNNIPFLKYLTTKNIPLILSTAMTEMEDVDLSVKTILETGFKDLMLMQCTGSYPAPHEDANLNVIRAYKERFNLVTGYSDHVDNEIVALGSIAMGAKIYERHLTTDKNLPGPDHRASSEPKEFKSLINKIRQLEESLGDGIRTIYPSEILNKPKLKKYIVTIEDIKQGDQFSIKNISTKRTGGIGLEPKFFENLLGKKSPIAIDKDTPVNELILSSI
jgi:N,N'-diacetyllegionaminate synthase